MNLLQKKVSIFPSMITFKEYYRAFVGIKDSHLENGWGWFIDIELSAEPKRLKKLNYNKPSQHVTVLKTIKEYPSIRSMKSMSNLQDSSMLFDMDEVDYKHRTNNKKIIRLITHTIGIIGVIYFCLIIKS